MLIQIGKYFDKMHWRYSSTDSETGDIHVAIGKVVYSHKITVASNGSHTPISSVILMKAVFCVAGRECDTMPESLLFMTSLVDLYWVLEKR